MLDYRPFLKLPIAFVFLAAPGPNAFALAADKDAQTAASKVAGILIDKREDSITVRLDGEPEPVKFLIGNDKAVAAALKSLFSVSRVQLTYETEGDSRTLVSIRRHVPKAKGTVTGEVVQNHGWWIEVKPKRGVPDGYACNFPFDENKEMMDKLKDLKEGDSVTISYTTDFERHRIQSLRKNSAPAHRGVSPQPDGASSAVQDGKTDVGRVAGIWVDRGENWITVKADGEEEPAKYVVDASDKKLQETFKAVFHACRVHLTYKQVGDARKLVSIQRHIIKETGTITGEVVKVYHDFWVEVKPKTGVSDAFAPGANYNDKAFMEELRGLKPGDLVTITYYTDFERHRIKSLRKNPARQSTGAVYRFRGLEGGRTAILGRPAT